MKESLRGLPRGTLSNSERSFTTFATTRPSSSVVWDQKWPLLLDANKLTKIFSSEYSLFEYSQKLVGVVLRVHMLSTRRVCYPATCEASFLSPRIIAAIADGTAPGDLSPVRRDRWRAIHWLAGIVNRVIVWGRSTVT